MSDDDEYTKALRELPLEVREVKLPSDARRDIYPRPGLVVAVVLELGIIATFWRSSSHIGLFLCLAYAWFSATWSFVARCIAAAFEADDDGDDEDGWE